MWLQIIGALSQNFKMFDGVYTGNNWPVSNEDSQPNGITSDGSSFWVSGDQMNSIFKYDADGVYTGDSFSVASEMTSVGLVTFDGIDLWVINNSTGLIFKYDTAGVYSGVSFDPSVQAFPICIASDGSFLYVSTVTNVVNKYTLAGAYTGDSFSVSDNVSGGGRGMCFYNGSLYISDGTALSVFEYKNEIYTGFNFSISSETTNPRGLCFLGGKAYQISRSPISGEVYEYE